MKSSRLLIRTFGLCAVAILAVAAHAQPASVQDEQAHEALLQQREQLRKQARQEIAAQRQDIEVRKQEAEKACWQRFAVENCLRDVRAQAREQDKVLRERELRINHEERQEKAAERLRAIEKKQSEKHVPQPVTATPRGEQPLQMPAEPAPQKTPAEIEQAQTARDTQARTRAAEQAARVEKQQAEMAERGLSETERSAKAKKNVQDKQQAAEARRARKADDIATRKGAPLPVPEGLPQPSK